MMLESRILDANVYYFLVSGYNHGSQDWRNVKVKASYPKTSINLALPTASMVRQQSSSLDFELGSIRVDRKDIYDIHLFCSSDSQRDDLGEYTKNLFLDTKKQFLDFNDGYPPTVGQAVLGRINFEFINMFPLRNDEFLDRAGRHRMNVRIGAKIIEDLNT